MDSIIISLMDLGLDIEVSMVIVAVAFIAIAVSLFDLAFSIVRIVLKNYL